MKLEEKIQIQVSRYLKLQHKDVVFTSESSGVRVPIGTAKKMKMQRSRHKLPDMIILEPKKTLGRTYHGLVLELKKDRDELYTKKGDIRNDAHIQQQLMTLKLLEHKGYMAVFACGFDEAKSIIDAYLRRDIH